MAMQSGQTWPDSRDQSVSRSNRTAKREAESPDQSGSVEEAQSDSGAHLWTIKIVAVVVALVAVLTLAAGGTIYAFGAGHCGSRDSGCSQEQRASCDGSGTGCGESRNCGGASHCGAD